MTRARGDAKRVVYCTPVPSHFVACRVIPRLHTTDIYSRQQVTVEQGHPLYLQPYPGSTSQGHSLACPLFSGLLCPLNRLLFCFPCDWLQATWNGQSWLVSIYSPMMEMGLVARESQSWGCVGEANVLVIGHSTIHLVRVLYESAHLAICAEEKEK